LIVTSACALFAAGHASSQITLIARGTLTTSRAGYYKDLSGLHNTLENGVSANLLGGLGSGLTFVSGNTFLAVPDRGPNAVPFNSLIDDTVTWIPRFHTLTMDLKVSRGAALPFTLTPTLRSTTLLSSVFPLVYGDGSAYKVGPGRPAQNNFFQHFFSGRSDNFDPDRSSADVQDARLDPESIRVSNDGLSVFISDEYGPYVYQFFRPTGTRLRTFKLPAEFFVAHPNTTTHSETAGNVSGRTPNKGMEGLAITPDGRTLVGMLQAATIQDTNEGGGAVNLLRFVTIDIASGRTTHEFAYALTTGSGVSELTAINNHEFLVDERDGKGLGDGSKAKVKQIFKIDIEGATDITGMNGTAAVNYAVPKTLVLDVVKALTANNYMTADQIPAKLEGLTFGPDVNLKGKKLHTLWLANDNDFLQDYSGPNTNPNQFFVFGVSDADLGGSKYVAPKHDGRR
jgi:hypothetical protein